MEILKKSYDKDKNMTIWHLLKSAIQWMCFVPKSIKIIIVYPCTMCVILSKRIGIIVYSGSQNIQ